MAHSTLLASSEMSITFVLLTRDDNSLTLGLVAVKETFSRRDVLQYLFAYLDMITDVNMLCNIGRRFIDELIEAVHHVLFIF
jgi:hypothetical protein